MPLVTAFKNVSQMIFGGVAQKHEKRLPALATSLKFANINMLPEVWVSVSLMATVLAFVAALAGFSILFVVSPDAIALVYLIAGPVLTAAAVGLLLYYYPHQQATAAKNSIDNNLPFALAHMSAVASSGIPPEYMFELVVGFKEFGKIAQEARLIVRNIKTFGMSSITAINEVAARTPSTTFKQVLQGISATIEKGGNISEFLKTAAEKSLFDYRIRREKYLKSLSTYADIYTAVLIAAPLILLSVLGILNIIGGDILGLGISDFILLITWVLIPAMNLLFLLFIQVTYPGA